MAQMNDHWLRFGFPWTTQLGVRFSSIINERLSSKSLQINVGEGMKKREPSYTVGGNVSWYCHNEKVWRFLKKLKIWLPYDPAILFLSINKEKMKTLTQKDTCTPMFIGALSTIVKTWKQPECPTDDWIKKMWYTHTHTHVCTHMHTHTQWNITQP